VRVIDRDVSSGDVQAIDPVVLARGIWYAADAGAKIINLSLAGSGDNPAVRDAVIYAQSKGALVIAAVGNRQEQGGGPSFPAGYDGVLGVGSIDINSARATASQVGSYVDVVAPGVDVAGTTRVGGHAYWTGTSFAAPFVAGAAALVWGASPRLTAQEVAERLIATASPAAGGVGPEYGAGVVDPHRAVAEGLSSVGLRSPQPVVLPLPDPAAVQEAAWWRRAGNRALVVTGSFGVVVLLVLLCVGAVQSGRPHGWAPRRRPQPVMDE